MLEGFQETIQTRDGRYTARVNHEHTRDEKDLRLMLGWSSHPSACEHHAGNVLIQDPTFIYSELGRSWIRGWSQKDPAPGEGMLSEEEKSPLEKSPSAFNSSTAAQQFLAFHTAHFVVVIPSEFCSSPDSLAGKEGHPREAKIMGIHKNVLDKQVGAATVIEVAA